MDDSDDESAVKVVADDASAIGPEDGGRTGERKVSDRHCRLSLSKGQKLTEETEDEPGLEVGRVKEREKLDVGDLLSASEGGRQRSEGGRPGVRRSGCTWTMPLEMASIVYQSTSSPVFHRLGGMST
jgi:hypothetical protein